jgi:hypothetical protein
VAAPVCEGAVYKVKTVNHLPPHYYIVLNAPRMDGKFLAVPLTDHLHLPSFPDVWDVGLELYPGFGLPKSSVVNLRHAEIQDQVWLNALGADFVGIATKECLERARCNVHWFKSLLKPSIVMFAEWFGNSWITPCGPCPQNPPKP